MTLLLASGATIAYTAMLIRKATGGGQWASWGKVVLFAVLILVGVVAFVQKPMGETGDALAPFFSGGATGLIMAMGFTFIALQGFDLIAAIAGEVKDPGRTIPKAMFASLGIALAIYIPLLFLISTVGVGAGEHIAGLSETQPDTVMAVAVERFMGRIGYWVVVVSALLSTLSALHANILAASRVALSMAEDRTLPPVLSRVDAQRRTPVMALYASALALLAIVFMIPTVGAAGAAASLIFLISFTLVHVMVILARIRGDDAKTPGTYRMPWFPALPAAGAILCGALAVFQAIMVPDAGGILAMWLGLGVMLYMSLFASGARTMDASAEALDPKLLQLRGKSPLVLLPIANPAHAAAMVAVANAMAPRNVGRVLLLSIVPAPGDTSDEETREKLAFAQDVVREALTTSFASGHAPEALLTASTTPWKEIGRIAEEHGCESLLLGLGALTGESATRVQELVNRVESDVAIMRSPPGWKLEDARRVLIPLGGRGDHHELRARVVGSICRTAEREMTFLRVIPASATEAAAEDARREIVRLAETRAPGQRTIEIVRSDDPAAAILAAAARHDVMILGLRPSGNRRSTFSDFSLNLATRAPCATILLSRRR